MRYVTAVLALLVCAVVGTAGDMFVQKKRSREKTVTAQSCQNGQCAVQTAVKQDLKPKAAAVGEKAAVDGAKAGAKPAEKAPAKEVQKKTETVYVQEAPRGKILKSFGIFRSRTRGGCASGSCGR